MDEPLTRAERENGRLVFRIAFPLVLLLLLVLLGLALGVIPTSPH